MARGFGLNASVLQVDDLVNSFIAPAGFGFPTTKLASSASAAGRQLGTLLKTDANLLEFIINGTWLDGGGKYWRDFKAALENQTNQRFDFGDGTEFISCTVEDCTGTRQGGVYVGASGNQEAWAYSAKVLSLEPFTRAKNPAVSAAQALTTGNGTNVTTFAVQYAGTARGFPTWWLHVVIPAGVSVSSVQLQNATTGETCTVNLSSLAPGTYDILFDASGTTGGAAPITPNNNIYGLLPFNSNGYGCTMTGSLDLDHQGIVPTLLHSLSIPPANVANAINVSITATGVLTTATLAWLAPARYRR